MKTKRKQIGVKIDVQLWRQFRAAAILQGRTATEALEEVMRRFLTKEMMNDLNALFRGKVGQRVGRRVAGKAGGRLFRKWWK